jgi:hypothetical protein
MTKLMAEAIDALRKLPEERQDGLAPLLIALAADETVGDLDWAEPDIAEANPTFKQVASYRSTSILPMYARCSLSSTQDDTRAG